MVSSKRREPPRSGSIPSADALPRPLGPGSFMWRDFGSYLFHLLLPQAFVLQSAHPLIDAAVGIEKKYKNDPWGRARNSTHLLWPIVYSRPEKAIDMGLRLRAMHGRIQAVDKDGRSFNALDPEAYAWVHLTGYYSGIRTHELFGTPPTPSERAVMFDEWKQVGGLLGIPEDALPRTEAKYWERFERMIDERLTRTEALRDILDEGFYTHYPVPPNAPWMPEPAWKAIALVWSHVMYRLTIATLPERFRTKLGIPYTALDDRLFRAFAAVVRVVYPRVPERMRYIPLAWRAITDARANPDAYRDVPPLAFAASA